MSNVVNLQRNPELVADHELTPASPNAKRSADIILFPGVYYCRRHDLTGEALGPGHRSRDWIMLIPRS